MTSTRLLPVVGLVAPSGSGKTTLLRAVVPILRQRGLRIGCLKHSHHPLSVDRPGKDSQLLAEAGADQVLLAAADGWALMDYGPVPESARGADLAGLLARFDPRRVDLVLVEGLRGQHYAKIEVFRSAVATTPLYVDDPDIIAVATDGELPTGAAPRTLPLDEPAAVADFIQALLKEAVLLADAPPRSLLRSCRATRGAASGWLSIRSGARAWMASIASSGAGSMQSEARPLASAQLVEPSTEEQPAVEASNAPAGERLDQAVHAAIYAAREEAGAVAGLRSAYAAAVGFQGRDLEPVDLETSDVLGVVPVLTLPLGDLLDAAPKAVAEALMATPACILAGQGVYAWGEHPQQALQRAALVEHAARILVLARQVSV